MSTFKTILTPRIEKELSGENSEIFKLQFLPNDLEDAPIQELAIDDPIADRKNRKASRLVHRYRNRVLFFPTLHCPVHCRYCFRRNELIDESFVESNLESSYQYIQEHSEIEEVVLSGGDPLVLNNGKLEQLLERLATIEHIKYLRFHTRFLTTAPERFDVLFYKLLNKYSSRFSKIVFVFHINHQHELKEDLKPIIQELLKSGISCLSQSVLLKNINDDLETLENLFKTLSQFNIAPYYLHHPDKVKGGMHFYVEEKIGQQLLSDLRQRLPGWMIPKYVIDSADGTGKSPQYNPLSR